MSTFKKALLLSVFFAQVVAAQTIIKTDFISLRANTVPASCAAGKIMLSSADSKIKICVSGAYKDVGTLVSGALPIAQGGTNNGSLAVTAGGVIYTDGSKLVNVGAGSSGQVLQSNAGSAPSWVNSASGTPFGQVQLTKSGSNLLLSAYNGNQLFINGSNQTVPSSGPTLSTSGLSSSTLYYVYAYMNSGTMTLETSATAYATDTTYGHKIKSGDSTRTFVGLAYMTSGTAFADSATQRFVRSWYNDPGLALTNVFTTTRSTSSTSYAEINTEIRVEFAAFASENVWCGIAASLSNATSTNNSNTACAADGTSTLFAESAMTASGNGAIYNQSPIGFLNSLAEGYHYATLVGKSPNSTSVTWTAVSRVNIWSSRR